MMGFKHKYHHDHSKDQKRFRHQSPSTLSSCMSTRNFTRTDEEQYREKNLTNKNRTMEKIEEEKHQAVKAKKKQQRESRKLHEILHEKFQRYSTQSNKKERKENAVFILKGECMNHRNTNNLYDDEKLLATFVWKKKLEKDGLSNISPEYLRTIMAQRVEQNKTEMEKLIKQRLEREFQNEIREKEKEFLQRIKEAEYFCKWKKQEELFHLNQIYLRSKLRIAHGRAKPIDLFVHYITDDDDDLAVGMHEPSTYLNGLTNHDLENLLADIRIYIEIEQQQNVETKLHKYDVQYWQDITTITGDELSNLRKLSAKLNNDQNIHIRRECIDSIIFQDVTETFKNKTLQQLKQLERCIRSKIGNEKDIDISYWESILSQLKIHMARTRLRDQYQLKLARKFQKIKEEQNISTTSKMNDNDFQSHEDLENKCLNEYKQGCYSPKLVNIHDFDISKYCILEADDWKKLEQQRQSIIKSDFVKSNIHDIFDELIRKIGSLTDDDLIVNEIISTDIQPLWSDKYKPCKPRFLNKVRTGYVWNSYNKKRHDTDNPPPKIIQGYKFNIFYPNLIDKNQQPSYSLTICENNRNFSILKFHAGPPYEDIAFKIVNEEWDKSFKHGFQSRFQNGILRLRFKFRK
ncbi:unnamed protein product [Rotaria sordida]|uniref:Splicing factor Cactin n=1 Tax=Rotaria sordida TaxID=392033 RepID=A0A815PFW7_9BILA|nr:unnamed protein product [Rotaria sordida]